MHYAVSDLHGCYDKYIRLLGRLPLREEDTLFILGDLVDRGDGGLQIILDLTGRRNICACMGNHDYYALTLLSRLPAEGGRLPPELVEGLQAWFEDGGAPTYEAYRRLSEAERRIVLSYLRGLPLYREIVVNGQKYFLAHTVPERERLLNREACSFRDFLFGKPEYNRVYWEDTLLVTGHTPTGFIDNRSAGRIWKGSNHIAIDCGAVFGNPIGCFCPDTREEFYVE